MFQCVKDVHIEIISLTGGIAKFSQEYYKKIASHSKYLSSQSENDKIEFGRLRRETKKMIRQGIKDLEIDIANKTKCNPKEFYSYVRNKKKLSHQELAHFA